MGSTLDISIVVPTYNRQEYVVSLVKRCLSLDPPPREIVIVDDHSDIDPTSALMALDPDIVRAFRLPENRGQATARNKAFSLALGKYLVSLDDDSRFLDNDALGRVWRRFEANPRCGILAFRTFSPGNEVAPACENLTRVADHITCGAGYRADLLKRTGYHLTCLRYEGEESDLSLKVMDAGYDILLDDAIRVFHDYDPSSRSHETLNRCRRFAVRNDLLRSWVYFPLDLAVLLSLWRTMSHLAFGLKRGFIGATLQGYAGFFAGVPTALRFRQPISRSAAVRYLRLRRSPQSI